MQTKNKIIIIVIAISIYLISILNGCGGLQGIQLPPENEPFQKLSEYQLFEGNVAELNPKEGVLPYDLNSPLFTDYAFKSRFVWMPHGKLATYNDKEVFDLPQGAILVKNFYYPTDFRKPKEKIRLIETRLLIHQQNGWEAYTYVWNEEQTEAELDIAGDVVDVNWTHFDGEKKQTSYIIPNQNQCKGCHANKDKMTPIGIKARHLNKSYIYQDGTFNQLEKWQQMGYLKDHPKIDEIIALVNYDDENQDLDKRARAWLDINCGHCHNPNGPGNTSGLNLYSTVNNPTELGIQKKPVAAGRAGHGEFDITPNQPDKSILLYRIQSNDAGIMMPELGRSMVHREGVALIEKWIQEMPTQSN